MGTMMGNRQKVPGRQSSCYSGAIVTGLVSEIVKERGAHIDMTETQKMIRDLKGWRRKAALKLDVGIYIIYREKRD